MKKFSKIFIPVFALAALFLGACTGAPAPADTSGGSKVEAAPVDFTGVIESINGAQWTINGQVITVDSAVVNDGPFSVGDTVKVEVNVQADGSILVTRVEPPPAPVVTPEATSTPEASSTPDHSSVTPDPTLVTNDNSNSNTNTSIDDNGNDTGNQEDDSSSSGSDDDSGSGSENSNSGTHD